MEDAPRRNPVAFALVLAAATAVVLWASSVAFGGSGSTAQFGSTGGGDFAFIGSTGGHGDCPFKDDAGVSL